MIKKNLSKLISEEFTTSIDEIHRLKDLGENALPEIDASLKKFSGMSSSFINTLSLSDLLNLLKTNGIQDANKLVIVSSLLFEEGKIYEDNNNLSEAFFRYERAFYLIFEVFDKNLECDIENYKSLSDIEAENLLQYELDEDFLEKVFEYFKITENYAKADDCIYELMNSSSDKDGFKRKAAAFYSELLNKSDEELKKGNLNRSEIKDYLNELSDYI
ncbi:tetratricopeptide (TPR) repeat protein [Clostridium acetobutylicum]|uniref:Uncharacterized protein n=1 Tax=Clostridium acetobutylicum (strain ATCC 824 / DSM 792 / JCM 1419 / IAM 19013 / LMG 5710 / NBRC 13948 / NRRL B-527 / VKM B-1787 / 2291 / W) TaxID=272562 RepID=Q97K24_CLOAB|nr:MULTISPECIES: DUF6483 family protein [Clostridium]AAK79071.1 Hypothetical protein CA_C1097 [Clostridium acetobutylicum ATCC 824]ADZ20146.1 Conserved hypothetical protein [Clostridium acetobutylicum EA 2018]AEI31613.1 hypothetical protein SMB_G1115 [Clostridium acetobutylicum DSM 1731]AWV81674.1 hypothetical protein DK921_16575 [Clostridium acetobutylicum]MBC2395213.1 hypothetical protein [Clostridium acetobutylicum]